MPQLQQAGYERSASPVGSIAKNLIPLFGAIVYAQAAQQQAAAQAEQQGLQNELVKSQIIEHLARARGGAGAAKTPTNYEAAAIAANEAGDTGKFDMYRQLEKEKGSGRAPSTIGLLQEANPGASPQQLLDKLAQFNTQNATDQTTARTTAQNKVKVRLPDQDRGDYVQMTTGIRSMGEILDMLETPGQAPSRMSGISTKLSGGMVSNPFWRKYASFRNDVINKRFKSRFTGPEGEALAQELPDPMSYAADPTGFLKSVRVAYDHAQGILKNTYQFDTDAYDMGPEVTMGVLGATAPRGKGKKPAGAAQGGSKTAGPANTVDSLINEVYGQ